MNAKEVFNEILEKRGLIRQELTEGSYEDLPSPSFIGNMGKLHTCLLDAKMWRSKVQIISDFDTDGVTSAAIMHQTLEEMGIEVETRISQRKYGYGLQKEYIDDTDADIILTLDCGITQDEEIQYAEDKGIEVFVIDHHERKGIPDFNFIDLKVKQGFFETTELSAGGLSWFLSKHFIGDKANQFLDLAAFSTVGDLVGVLGVNRLLVKEGLKKINNDPCIGLKTLIESQQIEEEITAQTIGWKLAPIINSVGRIGNNQLGFNLLTSDNMDDAYKYAKEMDKINTERKEMTKQAMKDIEDNLDNSANVIVEKSDIGKGIAGIVAGRLKEKHNKPVYIFNNDNSGSIRSVDPFDLSQYNQEYKDLFDTIGGHAYASGGKLKKGNYDKLKERLNSLTEGMEYNTEDYDLEIDPKIIDEQFMRKLDKFRPYSINFPLPKFKYITEKPIEEYRLFSDAHINFGMKGLNCIAFNSKEKLEILTNDRTELIFTADWNYFRGKKEIQLVIQSISKID